MNHNFISSTFAVCSRQALPFLVRRIGWMLMACAAFSVTATPPPSCDPAPAGIVAWWPGEGNTMDIVGTNNGTLVGAVGYTNGEVGQAFVLNGSQQLVTLGNAPSLQLQDFTIEAWVKRSSASVVTAPGGNAIIFGYGSGGYGLYFSAEGTPTLGNIGTAATQPTVSITDTNFHHLAVTKSGSTVIFYVDGIGYPAPALNSTFAFTTVAAIGGRGDNLDNSFLGLIDEVSVYNRPLASNEVAAIYQAGSNGKCPATPLPTIITQPTNQTAQVGGTAAFSVTAASSLPLVYQWSFNNTNILNATNATLALINVQLTNAGNYSVLITNLYGATNSFPAALTINPPPTCDPAPAGIVAWWPGEGNTMDIIGTNNGTLVGTVGYTNGEVGQAFVLNGNQQLVTVGNAPSLHLQDFTIEAWVKRSNTSVVHSGGGNGIIFGYGSGGYGLYFGPEGTPTLGNIGTTATQPAVSITDTNFHHLAVTKSGSTVIFYVDGIGYPAPAYTTTFAFSTVAAIGGRGDDLDNSFLGLIDEVSVYNRPLASNEVAAIYLAGSMGKCVPLNPPTIITQPTNQTAQVGGTAIFSVTVTGSFPMTYQWSFNNTNILSATNATLALANVQLTNTGSYSVLITNLYGSTNSFPAALTVNPPPSCNPAPAGIVAWWPGQNNANDIIGGNNGTLVGAVGYTNGEVGQAFVLNGSQQLVTVGNPASLQLQDFTIEAWVKRSDASIVSSGTAGNGIIFGYGAGGYGLYFGPQGTPTLGNISTTATQPAVSITDTNFHHLAVTKSGSTVIFYVDGIGYPAPAYNTTFAFSTVAAIGGRGDNFDNSFLGLIDEVSVYNRPLASNEVAAIYLAGSMGKCVPLNPPTIITQPTNQTAQVGGTAIFSVAVTGSFPLVYQWSFNNTNILHATNATLTLANVQLTSIGSYSVLITNLYGSTNSFPAVLTVNPPPCNPAPAGIVAWWPGEGNAQDIIGGNNGTLVGAVGYTNGEVGRAFVLNGSQQLVTVGNPASLQLQDFTIEAWVKRSDASIVSSGTAGNGIIFGYGSDGYGLYFGPQGTPTLGNIGTTATQPAVSITDTNFHHLAVTKSGSTVIFYVDGIGYPAPAYNATFTFSTVAAIGGRGDNFDNSFLGLIDEVSVYNRPLASNEVAAIYQAGSVGKCVPLNPPTIILQPTNQTVQLGGTATFTVVAASSFPLAYQWSFNNTNILHATNATLMLANVQLTNTGSYSVLITNLYGSTNSTPAALTVNPPTACTAPPSGIVAWWPGEGNTMDIIGTNNGTVVGTVGYTNGEVGQAFAFNGSLDAVTVGNPTNLQLQNFTIEAWIKRASASVVTAPGGNGIIFTYGAGGYGLFLDNNGTPTLSQIGSTATQPAAAVTDTNFHHVAVTKSGSTVVFYIDGIGFPAPAYNPGFVFNTVAAIGGRGDNLDNSFLGLIDEAAVYNRALASNEVAAIYQAGSNGKCPVTSSPIIIAQPTNQTAQLGGTATFSVAVTGSFPLVYQWSFNNTNILHATNATLTLANVQLTSIGSYSVLITNLYGSTNSTPAALTVNSLPACTAPPSGIVAWWPGEGSTMDIIGTNNGTVVGTVGYTNGEVGQAFAFNGSLDAVTVGNPTNLQLQNFTIEAWIKRASASVVTAPGGNGIIFTYGAGGYGLFLDNNGTPTLSQIGSTATQPAAAVTDTNFHHVAVTKSGSTVVFYIDGIGFPAPAYNPGFVFNTVAAIGGRGDNLANSFLGRLDEVAVYNRALASNEIAAIYQAGSYGKCSAAAPPVNPPTACTAPPSGIVAWWPGEGSTMDIIGTNNGTVVGTVGYTNGEVGQAFAFNGSLDAVTVGNPTNLQLQNFTIEAWIKRSSTSVVTAPGGNGIIFTYGAGGYGLFLDNNGTPTLSQIGSTATQPAAAVTDTNFHHVAVTKSGSTVVFYIDGIGFPAPAYNPGFVFNTVAAIGGRGDNLDNSFLGRLDEVAVYNRALASNEVAAIYQAGTYGKCVPLIPPTIITQPTNQTAQLGGTATFSVAVTGSFPLVYQWSFNNTNILHATNATLTLANVQLASIGSYSVLITNLYGATNSIPAALTVNPPPCNPAPAGIVAWWPGEGNPLDIVGTNNGTLVGTVGYTNGEVGQAFVLNGSQQLVTVGNAPSLQLQDFTIEAWVKRSSTSVVTAPGGNAIIFGYGSGGYGLYFGPEGTPTLGSIGTTATQPAVSITDTNFHHLAVTKSGSTVIFYVDGIGYPAPAYNPGFVFNTVAAIGGRGDNLDNSFLGLIDEVSVYNRPLASNEVATIYQAGSNGKCPAIPSPTILAQPTNQTVQLGGTATFTVVAASSFPLAYQWSFNNTNILHATNATLTLANVQLANTGNYSVLITNLYGATNSMAAVLTVSLPPTCDTAPAGIVAWWPGQNNANDIIGGNNGILVGAVGYTNGEVGRAFVLNGSQQLVTVGNPASLQLQDFTIEAWVKRSSTSVVTAPGGNAIIFGYGSGGYGLYFGPQGTPTLGNIGTTATQPAVSITDTNFHHLAVTKSGSTVIFYIDGIGYPAPAYNTTFAFSTVAAIGGRGDNFDNSFLGLIDEVSVYNRPLASNEVAAIYQAGSVGKCVPLNPPTIILQPTNQTAQVGGTATFSVTVTGSFPMVYQWSFNNTNILHATNATLMLANVQLTNTGSYSVLITNLYGSTNSTAATLTVVDVLDHFTWSHIRSLQFVNAPFTVAVQARDSINNVLTNFTGNVTLATTNGLPVSPVISDNFTQGVWTGTVSLAQTGSNVVLLASDGAGHIGLANPINVMTTPGLGMTQADGSLLIYWPVYPPGFVLESSPIVMPPQWVQVTTPAVLIGNEYLELLPLTSSNQLYRLHFMLP